jgi:hypothetical protein
MRAVVASVDGVTALEDQGVRSAGEGEGFRRERVVVELVEVTFVCELFGCPDAS